MGKGVALAAHMNQYLIEDSLKEQRCDVGIYAQAIFSPSKHIYPVIFEPTGRSLEFDDPNRMIVFLKDMNGEEVTSLDNLTSNMARIIADKYCINCIFSREYGLLFQKHIMTRHHAYCAISSVWLYDATLHSDDFQIIMTHNKLLQNRYLIHLINEKEKRIELSV